MTPRVVTISVAKRAVPALPCPGTDARRCGNPLTQPGKCRSCGRYMSASELEAALREAQAGEAGEVAA